jgi:hypothetical protein
MAMAQKPTPRTRHMDINYHVLIDWVEQDLLQLECIDTSINLADQFTKQLGCTLFHRHINYILGKVPPTYSCTFYRFHLDLHKQTTMRDTSQNVDTIDRPREIVTLTNEAVLLSTRG